jgi:molecular chaperone GrpE
MNEIEDNNLEEEQEELDVEINSQEVEDLRIEVSDYKNQLIRSQAELENQRKRMEREMDNARKFAIQDFVSNLLSAKDSMEKGLDVAYMEDGVDAETLLNGVTSTLKICNEAFKQAGVEEINPEGEPFNPDYHEAMSIKVVEGTPPNIVLAVYQKGYLLNGRLIRPARVEVSGS